MSELWMVTHGEFSPTSGLLTPDGERQAQQATEELLMQGLGRNAILLCSSAPWTVETSKTIRDGAGIIDAPIGIANLKSSGHHPDLKMNRQALIDIAERSFENLGKTLDTDRQMVVVNHHPLIAKLTGISLEDVEHGSVYPLHQPTLGEQPENYPPVAA